ncbi:hypothetical protein AALO_G00227580 [Alosa alosa]|uniref:Uncharacterized protein n=1 Tax=Alosa alosa TaxID=278164 RepID=A0AAV6G1I7_9TELE|nr:hypothetical protein AALO_G00227580 [Alosa alosa]
MTTFYRGTIESILSSCIAVCGSGSCTEYNRKALQRIVNTAGRIIGASLPSLKDIYTTHLTPKATKIVSDANHPAHNLFDLLPSGKRSHLSDKEHKNAEWVLKLCGTSPYPDRSLSHLSEKEQELLSGF